MKDLLELAIVIPTFNERANVEGALADVSHMITTMRYGPFCDMA